MWDGDDKILYFVIMSLESLKGSIFDTGLNWKRSKTETTPTTLILSLTQLRIDETGFCVSVTFTHYFRFKEFPRYEKIWNWI